jgi:glycerol-3-phosphate dehydrogenase (NAD(P)+)
LGKDYNGIRAAVVGSGNWGTAFSKVLIDAGSQTTLCTDDIAVAKQLNENHEHPNYPGVHISRRLSVSTDPQSLAEADVVFFAIPAQLLRAALKSYSSVIRSDAVICSLIKGLELKSRLPMSQVIAEVDGRSENLIAVLSGPNLASEIIKRQPAAATVASKNSESSFKVGKACDSGYFKTFMSDDVLGVELCGDLKNVVAVAAGMVKGANMGSNSLASLLTRGLKEISEIGVKLGARKETFMGLSGVGDLIATGTSPESRNFKFGFNLAKGANVKEALELSNGVPEGYYTSPSAFELAQSFKIPAPIIQGVYQVLYENRKAEQMLLDLLKLQSSFE